MEKLIVIGAGMASGRFLEKLFARDPDKYAVSLFNAEPRGNYNRIMLSPVLAGDKTYEEIVTHDDAWYAANNVTTHFGNGIQHINAAAKTVTDQNGAVHRYDHLVIGTGSSPFI
ncbi:MAG: FAD-dependent oxidoreductase, partial [Pseudomonadota bacterium]